MRKEASLPIRLDTELSQRLNRAAERLGLTKSGLIRILIKSFVDQLEANGGKITFPLRWQEHQPKVPSSPLRFVAETRAKYGGKGGQR
ncbi:MAG: ribbon-helix-helix protein, CopG family [Verrucomicrobia bacterium]|nr:ribbon-helix-helix protein, CopG family [Verrucomicrobiota bacterium]MBU4247887.1 ribbon-helix-helix protein, CopG family [Verrucomicrobiota bacterium]MBU4292251.1 ribbon-helix-helix protein, CopG family [Verrucomicrobiota bacterium]MBU4427980.1 ribbon-helix-helix protein, CopG family [Verrucomicrobiota bacterium]MBU4498029.1 ribbon-helix-helix protein, CopG family [Verrucomicrobiota bacterium]